MFIENRLISFRVYYDEIYVEHNDLFLSSPLINFDFISKAERFEALRTSRSPSALRQRKNRFIPSEDAIHIFLFSSRFIRFNGDLLYNNDIYMRLCLSASESIERKKGVFALVRSAVSEAG